jgi:hypothetical protein
MAATTVSRVRAGRFAQELLELGEHLLDRVEIGRVFGRKNSFAPA